MHAQLIRPLIVAGKKAVFAIEGYRPHRALDAIGIHLDTTIVEKAHQAVPVIEAVADHLGNLALVRDRDKPVLEPGFQRLDERPGLV